MSNSYHYEYFVIAKSDSSFLSIASLFDKPLRYVDIENATWFSSNYAALLIPYQSNDYIVCLENSNSQEFIFKKYIVDELQAKIPMDGYLMNFVKISHHHFKGGHSHKYIVMTYPILEEPSSLFDNDNVVFTGSIIGSSNMLITSYFVKDDTNLVLFKLTNSHDIVVIFERLSDYTITTKA